MTFSRRLPRWWWLASLAVHGTVLVVGARTAPPRFAEAAPAAPAMAESFEVETASMPSDGNAAGRGVRMPDELAHGGHRSAQNVDSDNAGGRGDGRSSEQGRLLTARAERVNLEARQANAFGVTQEQRIDTGRDRASPQDERRTPNPEEDPFLATGHGILLLRTTPSRAMPTEGVLARQAPTPDGQPESAPVAEMGRPTATLPSPVGSSFRPTPGLSQTHGASPRMAGPMATGRPVLLAGHASTQADRAELRPRDDRDADLLAASLLRNATTASVQDGPTRAAGVGGVGGGGDPGTGGGVGRGGRSGAYGEGEGWLSLDSGDARFARYFGEIRRRLRPLWADAFPRDEVLRLRQGTVILQFVIARDGSVSGVAIARRSGIDRFDTNVRDAVRGARLPPIPASLGWDSLRVRAPFEFRNPAVR